MARKKSKSVVIGKSENNCKQCGSQMYVKTHPQITEKHKNQYCYFSRWDYCMRCRKIFYDEQYRVVNGYKGEAEEIERQHSFMDTLKA